MPQLTEDDLVALAHEARHGDPESVVAQILTAVDEDGLADPADTSYALTLVAEISERAGQLDRAIALTRRAVDAEQANPGPDPTFAPAYLGQLLIQVGRVDEGLEQLERLRPSMSTDVFAGREVAEALEEAGQQQTAVEWLTPALEAAIARGAELDDDDPEAAANAEVIYELAAVRHRIREGLDVDHDEYDQLFHELEESLGSQEVPDALLFWPRADFERLTTDSPELAEIWELTWDDHRLTIEAELQQWSGRGVTDVQLFVGSADSLVAFAEREGLAVDDDEVEQGYLTSLTEQPGAPRLDWPPRRNDRCWCGSGDKYKKCCLIRSRT